jgi:hypothetical protein
MNEDHTNDFRGIMAKFEDKKLKKGQSRRRKILPHIRPGPRKVEYKNKLMKQNNPELRSRHSPEIRKWNLRMFMRKLCSVNRQ